MTCPACKCQDTACIICEDGALRCVECYEVADDG